MGVKQTLENTFNMSDINHGTAIVCFQAMVSLLQFEFPSFRFDKGGLFILYVIVAL